MGIRWVLQVGLAACGVAHAAALISRADDGGHEFHDAKILFLRDMKSDQPDTRARAVNQFSSVTQPGTAELLLKRGIADQDIKVRLQALKGLRRMASHPAVRVFLVDELTKSLRNAGGIGFSVELIRSLAVTTDEHQQKGLLTYLNEHLDSPKFSLLILLTAIDEDGKTGDADSVRSVKLLAKTKIFPNHFGYRRSVVEALTRIRRPEAIDALIELIKTEEGLTQYDAIEYLTRLTQQRFRDDYGKWTTWWKENRRDFDIPDLETELPEVEVSERSDGFYKNQIHAKRVVLVLNTTNRLSGAPIETLKRQLSQAIESLPESVEFNIVTYSCTADPWQPKLVPATVKAKKAAMQMIDKAPLAACAEADAGLSVAYRFDTEAIYFHAAHPPSLKTLNSIYQSNRIRRVSIHTIGSVINARDVRTLPVALRSLADRNYGTFQLIK